MTSPYARLDRPPLREAGLRRALVVDGGEWSDVSVVSRTGSTNADLAAAARKGAPSGRVLVAEEQTAGRGRLDRSWSAPARSGLTFSVLLRPDATPPARWGWFPLLAGVAVAAGVEAVTGLELRLKWPNDVLAGAAERKLAGVLAERVGDALVLGVGLNASATAAELPAGATSLGQELAPAPPPDRDPLLRAVLRELARSYRRFLDAGADPDAAGLRAAYRRRSATLGRDVAVLLPGGRRLAGVAADVDVEGRLVVDDTPVSAGDVVHLR